jgi:hypothetical protein
VVPRVVVEGILHRVDGVAVADQHVLDPGAVRLESARARSPASRATAFDSP